MNKFLIRTLLLLLVLPFSQFGFAAPTGPADVTGVLQQVNAASREITVSKKQYRVSLSARIESPSKQRVSLDQVNTGCVVELYFDQASGDVRDLVIVVYP